MSRAVLRLTSLAQALAWVLTSLALLTACDPVGTCAEEGIDCCATDAECSDFFGQVFGYCQDPGRTTGRCVECLEDIHCGTDGTCADDPVHGRYCSP